MALSTFFVYWVKQHGQGRGVCKVRERAVGDDVACGSGRTDDYCRGLMLSGDRKSVEPMASAPFPIIASSTVFSIFLTALWAAHEYLTKSVGVFRIAVENHIPLGAEGCVTEYLRMAIELRAIPALAAKFHDGLNRNPIGDLD
jgi:hypothetical protein